MIELLLLCTKNIHFSFDGKIYIQVDGVGMAIAVPIQIAQKRFTSKTKLVTYIKGKRHKDVKCACFTSSRR